MSSATGAASMFSATRDARFAHTTRQKPKFSLRPTLRTPVEIPQVVLVFSNIPTGIAIPVRAGNAGVGR